ncbi:MAG: MlaD family protein [Planctomycetota bacterium]|jgi:phospholipid/cholesterol/gamma-HCH transport system substrate-binding protein
MDKVKRDAVLGLVFFCGLTLLLVATATLGNFSIDQRQEETLFFPNAGGLRKGDPVLVLGTRYGQVLDIGVDQRHPTHRVKVLVQFEGDVEFRRDAKFQISDANMLGGKQLEIDPGQDMSAMWPTDDLKLGETRGNPLVTIGRQFDDDQLREAIGGINEFFKTLNEDGGSVQKLLTETDLYDKAIKFLDSLQKTADALATTEGVAGKLIHDQQMGHNVDRIIKNFDEVVAKVNSGHGPLGAIIHDEKMEQDIKAIADDVAKIAKDTREGKGTLGLLVSDEETRTKVKSIVDDLSEIAGKAKDPKAGLFGALMSDQKLLEDGRKILDDLAFLTDEVRKGESVLGKLMTDEEMGERLDRMFGQVIRAIEDAREAAPVSTFFQVFAGAF